MVSPSPETVGPAYELLENTQRRSAEDYDHDTDANTESQSIQAPKNSHLPVVFNEGADAKTCATKKRSPSSVMSDWFVWEGVGVGVSGGSLIAIVGILAAYNGKPQPAWNYMSLNSLIAWLTTASKGCILFSVSEALGQLKWVWFAQKTRPIPDLRTFDFASRGVLGAIRMLWILRARHFTALSCLAVILALGFDPFAQNLIHYHQKMALDASQRALVGNVSAYNSHGFHFAPGTRAVDPVLKTNVYNSVFNSDRAKPWSIPQYLCSSANCTWDPIVSLEAQAYCANITDHLSQSCDEITEHEENPGYIGMTNCTISLPRSNTTAWFLQGYAEGNPHFVPIIHGFTLQGIHPDLALIYTNASMTPVQFITPRLANISTMSSLPSSNNSVWDGLNTLAMWEATECAIEPVVRSSRPSVHDNIFTDETLAIWDARTQYSAGLDTTENLAPGWHLNPPWGADMGIHPNQTFVFGDESTQTIATFLRIIFSGKYWRDPIHQAFSPTDIQASLYAAADILQAVGQGDIAGCGVESAGRLSCSMRNVAAAISKTFRDSAYIAAASNSENADMARGRGLISVTYVSVRWQWIVLPLLVWVLGAGVLVETIWTTRRTRAPRWRNDPSPLLFLYRGGEINNEQGSGMPAQGDTSEKSNLQARLYETNGYITLG